MLLVRGPRSPGEHLLEATGDGAGAANGPDDISFGSMGDILFIFFRKLQSFPGRSFWGTQRPEGSEVSEGSEGPEESIRLHLKYDDLSPGR